MSLILSYPSSAGDTVGSLGAAKIRVQVNGEPINTHPDVVGLDVHEAGPGIVLINIMLHTETTTPRQATR